MNTFTPCRFCGKKAGPTPGYYYKDIKGSTVIVECTCHVAFKEAQALKADLRRSNVWDIDYDPAKDYVGTKSLLDVKALQTFAGSPSLYKDAVVYMYGPNGTQKTTLAMWAAKTLIAKKFTALYTLMETLTSSLTPDFDDTEGTKAAFAKKALSVDFLFIDEAFDKKKMSLYKSGYQIPFIDSFLRQRIDLNKKSTIFISNVPSKSIASEGFGENLQNFVARNTAQSTLTFLDVYLQEANKFNPRGLFE